jgi:tRNA threonylcarbamoyladenosine biosynthesis protein TsaE
LTDSYEETFSLGEKIGSLLKPSQVIALSGGLGVGKTTLAKGIGKALRVTEEITSPTYTIISEYEGKIPLYHIDTYRLSGADDAEALGIEEYLNGKGVCVIEWSERIRSLIPEDAIQIVLSLEANKRKITISGPADFEEALR